MVFHFVFKPWLYFNFGNDFSKHILFIFFIALYKNLRTQTTSPGKVDPSLPFTCDRQSLEISTLDDFHHDSGANLSMNSEATDDFDLSHNIITYAESKDEPNTESACDSSQGKFKLRDINTFG